MTPLNPPIVPPRTYVVVWIALLLLLLLNWGLAQFNLGPFNVVVALAIALVQMLLMLLYLMHVRFNTPVTRVFVAAGFIWVAVMADLTLSDYLTRGAVAGKLGKSWEHGAWPTVTNALPNAVPSPPQPGPLREMDH